MVVMVAVTRTHRSGPGRFPARSLAVRTAAFVVVAAAVLLGMSTRPSPAVVPEVAIVNEGPYPLRIGVGQPGEPGAIDLGVVEPGTTRRFLEVLDQGSRWSVSFRSGVFDLGAREVDAAELDVGWVVPPDVHDQLEALGVPPVLNVDDLARVQGTNQ